MASDKVQTTADVRPETKIHSAVASFASGTGPILSRADQTLALHAGKSDSASAAHHLPSNEDLLQQLRRDAKQYEEHDAPRSLEGLRSPYQYNAYHHAVLDIYSHERGILSERDKVAKYTPEQLKDIGDIANAANDPAKLKEIMKRFSDPQKLLDLQEGLRLEEERRGNKIDIGTGFYTNDAGQRVPYLRVSNIGSNSSRTYDGPAHTPTAAELQGFELSK